MIEDPYKKFIGKDVILAVDAGTEKPYTYRGILIATYSETITIEDEKSGTVDINKRRIIQIKHAQKWT